MRDTEETPAKIVVEDGDLLELAMRTGSIDMVRLAFSLEHFNLLLRHASGDKDK